MAAALNGYNAASNSLAELKLPKMDKRKRAANVLPHTVLLFVPLVDMLVSIEKSTVFIVHRIELHIDSKQRMRSHLNQSPDLPLCQTDIADRCHWCGF